MSATVWDVLFCLLVALGIDLPEVVTAHPEYRAARGRFCERQQIDGFFFALWWLDSEHEIFQPSTVQRVWLESLSWPAADDGCRFGWTLEQAEAEENWSRDELARLLLLAEMAPPWERSQYEPWLQASRVRRDAFYDLGQSLHMHDPWRPAYARRLWLLSLRERIGAEQYARGVMPSRAKPW